MKRRNPARTVLNCSFLLLSLALGPGCNAVGAGGGGKRIAMDDFPEAFAEAYCQRAFECCSAGEIERSQEIAYADEEECRSTIEGTTEIFTIPIFQRSEREGWGEYDPRGAGDCVRAIQTEECDAVGDLETFGDGFCSDIMIPAVEEGGTCGTSMECVTGMCLIDDFENETGSCGDRPAEGEECYEYDTPTGTEETCGTGLRCYEGTCVRPAAPGAECSDDIECQTDCEGGTCAERLDVGGRCFDDDDCQSRNCDADGRCAEATGGECTLL